MAGVKNEDTGKSAMAATQNCGMDKQQFTCAVCIQNYKTPRYLPTCGHTFCENCLMTYTSNLQLQGSKLDCPVCRKSISVPENTRVTLEWVQTFPLNTVIIKMMESGSESPELKTGKEEVGRECDPCKERGEVTVGLKFCMDCHEVYCKTCIDSHKAFKMSRHHNLIDMEDISAEAIRSEFFARFTKCSDHPEREMEFFCKTHDDVICAVCPMGNHKGCNVVEISALIHDTDATRFRAESKTLMSQFRAAITHLTLLKQLKEQNKMNIKKTLKEIREKIEQLRDQVVTLMDNVVRQVSEVTKQVEVETEDRIDKDMSRLSETQLLTEEKVAFLDTIRQHGLEKHLFISNHLMKTQMDELDRNISEEDNNLKNIDAELKLAGNIRKLIKNKDVEELAQVTVNEIESGHKYLGDVSNSLRDGKLMMVGDHTIRPNVDCKPRYGQITMHKDGTVMLCEYESVYLCLFNPKDGTILKKQLPYVPFSGTQIDDNRVAVNFPYCNAISIVTLTAGNKYKVERTVTTQHLYKPYYIVALSNGQLAVAWMGPPAFGVIDISGPEIVQKSYFDQDKNGRKLESFYYLAVDEKRKHVIQSVYENDGVCCFDFSGEPVFRYSDPNLKKVQGVALDKCGNIYVCSCVSPGSIHKLSPTGEQIAMITEGIPPYPWAICSDNAGTGFWMTSNQTVSPEKIRHLELEQTII